jgi:hypothetical protein
MLASSRPDGDLQFLAAEIKIYAMRPRRDGQPRIHSKGHRERPLWPNCLAMPHAP